MVRVGQGALHGDGAGGVVDLGVDGADFAFADFLRGTGNQNVERVSRGRDCDLVLREGELHVNGILRVHGHDGGTGVDELAEADLADAEHAVEGGGDLFAGEQGGGHFQRGDGLAQFAFGGVDFGGGQAALGFEFAFAVQIQPGEVAPGFCRV